MPRKHELKVDPDRTPSRIVLKDELRVWLEDELAPLTFSERTVDLWVDRGILPGPIALGGLRPNGKAVRVAWLRADVEAFLDGLSSQPRLKAPKVWKAAKSQEQAEA